MVSQSNLRIGLSAVIVVSSLGIVRVGLWPMDVPQPNSVNPQLLQKLRQAGWTQEGVISPQSGQTVSWAEGYRFKRNTPDAPGRAIELALLPARVRGAGDLAAKTIREAGLSHVKGTTTSVWRGEEEWLRIQPANNAPVTLTSCFLHGEARSSSDALVKLKLENDPANTNASRLRMVAGLQQPRDWGCLLVELQAESQDRILKAWPGLQSVLSESE
jgi:hypothetical protein